MVNRIFGTKILIFVSIFVFSSTIFAKNSTKKRILNDLWPRVYSVAVNGSRVAATTDAGLRLFDCTGNTCRETDRFVTPDALSAAVFLGADNLMIGGGRGLWMLHIDASGRARPLWHKKTLGAVRAILVTPKLVIVAMGALGIQIYSRQGSNLFAQRLYPTRDYCRSIALRSHILFAACGYEGLLALDITDPRRPKRLFCKRFAGPVHHVLLYDDMAVVSLGCKGAAILTLRDSRNPQVVGRVRLVDGGRASAVFGHFLYVADGMRGVGVFDITDPRNPVNKGHLDTRGAAVRLLIAHNHLFVANDYAGLAIYDLSTPASPDLLYRTTR